MPFRKSARIEIENQSGQAAQHALLQHRLDQAGRPAQGYALFLRPVPPGIPRPQGQGLPPPRNDGQGPLSSGPSWASGCAARPGSARATRRSISTARRSPRSGARGPRITSSPPGAWRRRARPISACRSSITGRIGGHISAYRWHIHDPIVFETGIKVTLEHMGWMSEDENPEYKATSWNEREDDYASVAFWYQTGAPTFAERAPGAAERRLPEPGQDGRARLGSRRGPAARRRRDRESGRRAQRERYPRIPAGPASGSLAGIPDRGRGQGAAAAGARGDAGRRTAASTRPLSTA